MNTIKKNQLKLSILPCWLEKKSLIGTKKLIKNGKQKKKSVLIQILMHVVMRSAETRFWCIVVLCQLFLPNVDKINEQPCTYVVG